MRKMRKEKEKELQVVEYCSWSSKANLCIICIKVGVNTTYLQSLYIVGLVGSYLIYQLVKTFYKPKFMSTKACVFKSQSVSCGFILCLIKGWSGKASSKDVPYLYMT